MIQDPENSYIDAILSSCDLRGRDVLEIGCGRGRITRDLAKYAGRLVATDPDDEAIRTAQAAISAGNVTFIHSPDGMPDLAAGSFDLVIYTLSLHHLPPDAMGDSLRAAARLLRDGGCILVVEPADGGSLTTAKERFGAGSGDERPARQAAVRAMEALSGWSMRTTVFRTLFHFDDEDDFLSHMLPDFRQRDAAFQDEVKAFLARHRSGSGITLDAGRQLTVLYGNQSS